MSRRRRGPSKAADLRDTGISVLGPMPWSTHVSLFYETRRDLLDALVPYFKAGLKGRELCVWLWSEPGLKRAVRAGLRASLPAFDEHFARGKIQFVDGRPWLRASHFDRPGLIRTWDDLAERALAAGYAGLRGAGDHTWLGHQDWGDFSRFEDTLHGFVANRRIIFVCTYPLHELRATDILDSARTHDLAIARRRGTWDVLERPSLKATKEQIQRRNDCHASGEWRHPSILNRSTTHAQVPARRSFLRRDRGIGRGRANAGSRSAAAAAGADDLLHHQRGSG